MKVFKISTQSTSVLGASAAYFGPTSVVVEVLTTREDALAIVNRQLSRARQNPILYADQLRKWGNLQDRLPDLEPVGVLESQAMADVIADVLLASGDPRFIPGTVGVLSTGPGGWLVFGVEKGG